MGTGTCRGSSTWGATGPRSRGTSSARPNTAASAARLRRTGSACSCLALHVRVVAANIAALADLVTDRGVDGAVARKGDLRRLSARLAGRGGSREGGLAGPACSRAPGGAGGGAGGGGRGPPAGAGAGGGAGGLWRGPARGGGGGGGCGSRPPDERGAARMAA